MDRKSNKKPKKLTYKMQANLLLVFCVIILSLVFLIGKLMYIQNVSGDKYGKIVLARASYTNSYIPYKRGEIKDRNGTTIARSELRFKLIVDPNMLLNQKLEGKDFINPTKEAVEQFFGIPGNEFISKVEGNPDMQYIILEKELEYALVEEFKEYMQENEDIKGVRFEEEYVRKYLYPNIASDVIGFTTAEGQGYWGLEEYYNNELSGLNGIEYGYYDASLNVERTVKKPQDGNSIVTTLDLNAQQIVQRHINQFNDEYGSLNIGVLIMDPNTGGVLAMASNEEYDLNSPRDLTVAYTKDEIDAMNTEESIEALNKMWGNYVISDGFEPGSTFKPFTIAAALEESLISDNSSFYCDGFEIVGGHRIRCSKRSGHGDISLSESLQYSCNDALMHIVFLQGKKTFYDYQKSFLFGDKTGIDLPGEGSGILVGKDALGEAELATSSFGQSFNVTMIQMLSAYSSLINGGNYYEPHIAKEFLNEEGATVNRFDKVLVKKTVSETTSKLMREYMYKTVEEGTAKGASVPGYDIGGKTGTAQKLPRDAKTYVVSFIGAAPAQKPEMAIYVVVDEPQNVEEQADSSLATKLAGRILSDVLPALDIYPDGDIDYNLPSEDNELELPGDEDEETGEEINVN